MLLQSSTETDAVIGVDSIQFQGSFSFNCQFIKNHYFIVLDFAGSNGLYLNSSFQVPTVLSNEELFLYSSNQRIQFRGPKQVDISLHRHQQDNTSVRMTSAAQVKIASSRQSVSWWLRRDGADEMTIATQWTFHLKSGSRDGTFSKHPLHPKLWSRSQNNHKTMDIKRYRQNFCTICR